MARLRIELVKSIIGRKPNHIATVKSLGLKKMHDVVEHNETPELKGEISSSFLFVKSWGGASIVKLNELSPSVPKKNRKRIGRGNSSGWGKTAGKGSNGQNSRAGGGVKPYFEGGQMPIYRRVPKRGFSNAIFKK